MLIFAFAKQNFTYKRNNAIIIDTASVRDGERVRISVRRALCSVRRIMSI